MNSSGWNPNSSGSRTFFGLPLNADGTLAIGTGGKGGADATIHAGQQRIWSLLRDGVHPEHLNPDSIALSTSLGNLDQALAALTFELGADGAEKVARHVLAERIDAARTHEAEREAFLAGGLDWETSPVEGPPRSLARHLLNAALDGGTNAVDIENTVRDAGAALARLINRAAAQFVSSVDATEVVR